MRKIICELLSDGCWCLPSIAAFIVLFLKPKQKKTQQVSTLDKLAKKIEIVCTGLKPASTLLMLMIVPYDLGCLQKIILIKENGEKLGKSGCFSILVMALVTYAIIGLFLIPPIKESDIKEVLFSYLPLRFFLKNDIQYAIINNNLVKVKVKKIKISTKQVNTNDKTSVKELLDILTNVDHVTLIGHICGEDEVRKFAVEKKWILEYLKKEKSNKWLRDIKWKISVPMQTIVIRNDFIPKCNMFIRTTCECHDILTMLHNTGKKEITKALLLRTDIDEFRQCIGGKEVWINTDTKKYLGLDWYKLTDIL